MTRRRGKRAPLRGAGLAALLVATQACSGGADVAPSPVVEPTAGAAPDGRLEPPRHWVEAAGVELTLELPWPTGGVTGGTDALGWYWRRYTRTTLRPQPGVPDVSVDVLSGARLGLDEWARRLPSPHTLGPVGSVRVCDREGRGQEATIPEHETTVESQDTEGGGWRTERETLPTTTVRVLSFRHADRDVLVTWSVPEAERASLRRYEDALFASVLCR